MYLRHEISRALKFPFLKFKYFFHIFPLNFYIEPMPHTRIALARSYNIIYTK